MRDPSYTKAFSRRAAARFALKKYEDAMADYKRVLTLEPNNKFAKIELERIEKVRNFEICVACRFVSVCF
jgi:RNA polymerase II-associated protein 3